MPAAFDLFLGYAGPDRALAQDLVARLHGRVSVWWDQFLAPDETFDSAIPAILANSRLLVVLVSSLTWDDQAYASEELTIAVQHARRLSMRIVPLWIDEIPPERRPYGIVTTVGLSLPAHGGCVGCIASKLVEVVLRARTSEMQRSATPLAAAARLEAAGPGPSGESPRVSPAAAGR